MITFKISVESSISPEQICEGIFDVDNWTRFKGYGPLPGISKVIKLSPADTLVGTVFHVENSDGSKHKETVEYLDSGRCLVMRMDDFSPPLSKLATHFVEIWEFDDIRSNYRLKRTFELYPKTIFAAVPLWIISRFLKIAVASHTQQIINLD